VRYLLCERRKEGREMRRKGKIRDLRKKIRRDMRYEHEKSIKTNEHVSMLD
jgi:hypothetical protein